MLSRRSSTLLGSLGVACFSGTPVATRVAAPVFGAVAVTCTRILVAAALGGLVLTARGRFCWPGRRLIPRLLTLGIGVAVLYPLCLAFAVEQVPASHAAVVLALLPVATALAAVRRGERPRFMFWAASTVGVAAVAGFALRQANGSIHLPDVLLVVAVASTAIGYAEGAEVAREIGAVPALCWALILLAPASAAGLLIAIGLHTPAHVPDSAWAGLAYASVISMFIGLVLWYGGLAGGGTARIGQLNLAQPLLTIVWSAAILGEHIAWTVPVTAIVVVAAMAVCLRAQPRRDAPLGAVRGASRID